ncbi:hypothetical protein RRG08_045267 [Elysia crispata]|uniref:Uncharacterized protein n=1 Tax=Elysia crispata TaxID=231223 RepID=A0AAE1DQQ3_9GAST|nr:hypothetical protein RRG08_045267 [Elysia crispata]
MRKLPSSNKSSIVFATEHRIATLTPTHFLVLVRAHVMYRLACDTNHVGQGCAINCLRQPNLQVCSAQAGHGPAGVRTNSSLDQGLRYFGSPLARCPARPHEPGSTLSPTDVATSVSTTGSPHRSSWTSPDARTSDMLLPSETTPVADGPTSTVSSSIKPGRSTTLPSLMPTSVENSNTPDATSTSSSGLMSSEDNSSLLTSLSQNTEELTLAPSSTVVSPTTSLTHSQTLPTTSTQTTQQQLVVSSLITSSTEPPVLKTSTQKPPSMATPSQQTSPLTTSTKPLLSLTASTLAPPTVTSPNQPGSQTTATPSETSRDVPVPPATLPVVQYTSTDPSRDPLTSAPSVTIPGLPGTTALAQTADNPMRYWAGIVGGVVGGLAVVALLGFLLYRSRQRTLQKRQEIYTVTPQSISSIEENGTSGRSDVPMTTALL